MQGIWNSRIEPQGCACSMAVQQVVRGRQPRSRASSGQAHLPNDKVHEVLDPADGNRWNQDVKVYLIKT